jgi:hypothetical protein
MKFFLFTRAIEKHNLGGATKFSTEWAEKIKDELTKQNLSEYLELANLIGRCKMLTLLFGKIKDERTKQNLSAVLWIRTLFCSDPDPQIFFGFGFLD